MFKELIHIFRTYFITFRYFKKINVSLLKNLTNIIVVYFLIISIF